MDIIVLIKRVPDTETRVKVAADGKSLEASGVQYVMAPYDEIAVEKAIQIKEAAGAGTVTVMVLGPPEATKELRTALAMGADKAVHVAGDDGLDALATARALHGVLQARPFDLILTGRQATDVDDAAVGPMLAALLSVPCVTAVGALAIEGGKAVAKREIEGETEVLEVDLPCVVTAQKSLAEPRYPGLKGIMAAKKKPLETVPAPAATAATTVRTLSLPAPRGAVLMIDPTPEGMRRLLQALRGERKVL